MLMVGIPTYGRVSVAWAQHFRHFSTPLGGSCIDSFLPSKTQTIAEKRNWLIREAIKLGVDTLFMLGDDVIPPDQWINLMLAHKQRGLKAVTGVYWTKQVPPMPYIWRDFLKDPYLDWKAGELFKVDFAGCDCLMLDVEMLKGIPEPWFSLEYDLNEQKIESGDGKKGFTGQTITEDFYFYTKLKQHGVDLWCDSSIQCLHEDRETGMTWGLTSNMPQHPGITIVEKGLLIADIGCGNTVNPLAYDNKVIRYDFDEEVNPDFRCDVRCIPEYDNVFDIVQANHVLEHLPFRETTKALKEWFRIVKPGGRLEVRVPDLGYACSEIARGNYGVMYEQDDITMPYNLLMLYGLQSCDGQIHFNGFDENLLRQACEIAGFKNFTVEKTGAQDSNGKPYELTATIHKNEATVLPTLSKEWEVINETTD